jgi:hypothetical protein
MVLELPNRPKTDIDLSEGEYAPLVERGTIGAVEPKQLPATIVNKLSAILTPEHLPGPAKLVYRPILLAAAGIHALLLFMPQGKEAPKPPEQKEKPITISQVATGKAQTKLPTTKLPAPKVAPPPKVTLPKVNLPTPTAPVLPKPTPSPAAEKPPEPAKPTQPQPQPLPDVKPNQQTTTPPPPGGGAQAGDPFEAFVEHPAAQMGQFSVETVRKVPGSNIDTVVEFFKSDLTGKQFKFQEQEKSGEKAVYEVSKNGVTRYLTVLSDGSDVAYVLLAQPFPGTMQDITAGNILELPAQFTNAMNGIASEDPPYTEFDIPQNYFNVQVDDDGSDLTSQRNEVFKTYTIPDRQPAEVIGVLDTVLRDSFKEVKEEGTYGGGVLYKLSNGSKTFYFNVIPRKNVSKDSIGVVLTQRPG